MEIIKELPSLEEVNIAEVTQQADREKTDWRTFSGQKTTFPVGKAFVLAFDANNPVFGDGDFRHVRLTAVGESHETVSIPLSYFTRPLFMRDREVAAFRKDGDNAILLGGTIPHDLHIPAKITEDELIAHLHGMKVIIPEGQDQVPFFQLDYNNRGWGTREELLEKLVPKTTFKMKRG